MDSISYGVIEQRSKNLQHCQWYLNGTHVSRAGRADPATSVSRATRNQTDPLAPPGRRMADVACSF
jgi:hypothetical protein